MSEVLSFQQTFTDCVSDIQILVFTRPYDCGLFFGSLECICLRILFYILLQMLYLHQTFTDEKQTSVMTPRQSILFLYVCLRKLKKYILKALQPFNYTSQKL